MTETLRLWTTGDIARELEVRVGLVYNWANRGVYWLPRPYATTQEPRCQSLWTDDQAKEIMAGYHARLAYLERIKRAETPEA